MAFAVFQGGSNLYGIDERGTTVLLSLPTNVTIDGTLRPRFIVFNNYAIIVNSPSRAITVDANLNVRVLTPDPPTSPLTLAAGAAGTLSGTFQMKQTFIVRDAFGVVIGESDFGPVSNSVTIANQFLAASGMNLSQDLVSATKLYRTTSGTSVFFENVTIDGNQTTSEIDETSDALLSTLAAPSLGTPPNMYLIAEYNSRLFGVGKSTPEQFNYTEVGTMYAWPSDNVQPVPRTGSDSRGITGFARRRDALGIGRSNGFYQFTGTDDTNFTLINLSENCGIEAPDSVCVYRDIAYFLWKDGVYQWDANGINSITDGKIRRWFTTNGTFNLSRLQYAFAHIDPIRHKYRLFLASAGSSSENCWIEYDFLNQTWWGPHVSQAMIPSAAFQFSYSSGLFLPMYGGRDGFLRMDRLGRWDDNDTPIDFDCVTVRDTQDLPTKEKFFGQVMLSTKPQSAPATPATGLLHVEAAVGEVDALRTAQTSSLGDADLTQGYNRLARIGQGKAYKLRFRNNTGRTDVNIRGFEIPDVKIIGQR